MNECACQAHPRQSNTYRAFLPTAKQAENALSRLIEQGQPRERLRIFANDPAAVRHRPKASSNAELKDVLVDALSEPWWAPASAS
jgi:hypothetical protein